MKVNNFEISQLVLDDFRLDGGAMFGSVPKNLWSKKIAADEQNRIQMCSRILVLKKQTQTILIDLGCGKKEDEKFRKIFQLEARHQKELSEIIPNVTDIILTHLHFDHCGGITYLDSNKTLQLSYPQAKVYLQKRNWERALNPSIRERASYLTDNIQPLKNANMQLTSNAEEIIPGIKVFEVNGHTDGMQWILIGDEAGPAVAYVTDLIPTAHHIALPYIMGYDLCASTTLKEKEIFLEKAVKYNWILVFEHDFHTAAAKVAKDEKGNFFLAEKVELNIFGV